MRQGQGPNNNNRRPRGRHHGGGHGGGGSGGHDRGNSAGNMGPSGGGNNNRPRSAASLRHQTFDSNCIDVRVRGNAWQVHEKYQALARDAQSSGDRVAAENYLQHAEHYYRIIEAINEATAAEQPQQQPRAQQPAAPFGQQPEIPNNYYGSPNNAPNSMPPGAPTAASQAAHNPQGADGNIAVPSQGEAEVHRPAPPQQQNPFFASEEMEEQGEAQPLVASR